jgi:hypothetical protein
MAFGTKDKGREREDALKKAAADAESRANAAITTAAAPDPLEERRRARSLAIDKWDMGESGPKDIRNLPGADTAIALFKDAKASRDAGRIGRGYGMLADGANPNFTASLDKEMQLERDLAASGALEENVEGILEGNKAEMYGLSGMGNSRNQYIAGLRASANESAQERAIRMMLLRQQQPSFLRTLSQSLANQLGNTLGGGGVSASTTF